MVSVSGLTRHSLALEGGIPAFVLAFNGSERLGQVYRYQIYFVVENQVEIDVDELVGGRATLTTERDQLPEFNVHGVVAQADLLEVLPTHTLYHVELVPEFWRAALSRHTRVFVDVTIKDVLQTMFDVLGFDAESVKLAFSRSDCRKYPQICQFEESDLAFMTRWMEKEGLHYYFEQRAKEECVVVVSGQPAARSLAPSPLRYATGTLLQQHAIHRFRPRSRLRTRTIAVRAYDASNPSATPEATSDLGGKRAGTGLSFALSTEIEQPTVDREAQLLEEIEATQRLSFSGDSDAPVFRVGYHIDLDGHPLPRLDGQYYISAVQHSGLQPCPDCVAALSLLDLDATSTTYSCSFECVRGDVVYRLPRETPSPRVYGTLSGVVDGPATEDYAQIDSAGRYRVRLRFDEQQKVDGSASMWVRMLQNHAGSPEGIHFPLRKGTEVMLVFLGGDPDQPLIVGAVNNALNPSPVTAANRTKNVLHTGGDNVFELEDTASTQHIDLRTPPENTEVYLGAARLEGSLSYNLIEKTDGDGFLRTGRSFDVTVGGTHTEIITGAVKQTYGNKRTTSVADDVVELFSRNQTTKVLEDVSWEVVGDYDGHTRGDHTLKVDGKYKVDYDEDTVTTTHGNSSTTLMGATNENFLGAVNSNYAAAVNSNFGGVVNNNFVGLAANTYLAGYVNLNLAAGLDINAAIPLELNIAGSLTCDFALAGSLFVGGTLDIRLAVDITIALCSLSVYGLAACENIIYLNNNVVNCSGFNFDLKKAIVKLCSSDSDIKN
ncbi:MAG: type VI secretion system Vgr family protein [Polyangiaceae bacterium]